MPDEPEQQSDFSLLLASSVHDMKNSLGMLLNSLGELVQDYPPQNDDQRWRYGLLEGEAARIKNDLTYLLGLYRLQEDQLPFSIDEVFVLDLLQMQALQNQLLFEMKGLDLELDCAENLKAYFDEELVSGIINNVLVNSARYAREQVIVRATQREDYLCIEVLDDGDGFPPEMLKSPGEYQQGINFQTGSTNLGLHFAARISALHRRGDDRGFIEISNLPDGGGRFALFLP